MLIILALAGLINLVTPKSTPGVPPIAEAPPLAPAAPVEQTPPAVTPAVEPEPLPPLPRLPLQAADLRKELLAILTEDGSQEFTAIFEQLYRTFSERNLEFGGMDTLRNTSYGMLQKLLAEGIVQKDGDKRFVLSPLLPPASLPQSIVQAALPTPPPATIVPDSVPPAAASPTPPTMPEATVEVDEPETPAVAAAAPAPPAPVLTDPKAKPKPPPLPDPALPLPDETTPDAAPTPAMAPELAATAPETAPSAADSFGLFSSDDNPAAASAGPAPSTPDSPFVLMEDIANASLAKPAASGKTPKKDVAPAPPVKAVPPLDEAQKLAEETRVKSLRDSTSLFIRLHADLPVHWQIWGPAVIEQARREKKMIYVSVGFSSCHWTQSMARESFADPVIADILNDNFVCALADRQQRPDLDNLFLNLMQSLSGNAGWPVNMWLTPDLQPFFGCSYLPLKSSRDGPGFAEVVSNLLETIAGQPLAVEEQARTVDAAMRELQTVKSPDAIYDPKAGRTLLTQAAGAFAQEYDFVNGGFGTVPKFPESLALRLLLRATAATGDPLYRDIATGTLNHLGAGALRDQLGGGFHRYSMTVDWSQPRYEKMLVDNVLVAEAALDAFQATEEVRYAALARETLDFLARDMALSGGGFGVSLNSESTFGSKPHVDGGYYAWRAEAIDVALGAVEGLKFRTAYHLPVGGNLPMTELGVIYQGDPAQLNPTQWDADRRQLLEVRAKREKPLLDTLAVCGLNAQAASVFRRAGAVLAEPQYSEIGEQTLSWTLRKFAKSGADGGLYRSLRGDEPSGVAYLEDYASLAGACLDMAESSFDQIWMAQALKLSKEIKRRFWSQEFGVFYQTDQPVNDLPVRPLDLQDAAAPSGSSLATALFARLGLLLENAEFKKMAGTSLATVAAQLGDSLGTAPALLRAEPLLAPNAPILVVVGRNGDEAVAKLLAETQTTLLPEIPLLLVEPSATGPLAPLVEKRLGAENPLDGMPPTVFVCRENRVGPPLRTPEEVRAAVRKLPVPIQIQVPAK